MKQEKSCGIIVVRRQRGRNYFLILQHRYGEHWGLCKGHTQPGETEAETAHRELLEETGLEARLVEGFRKVQTYSPRSGVTKDVVYFLGKVKEKKLNLQKSEIIHGVWLEAQDAVKLVSHKDTGDLILQAQAHLENL